MFLMNFAFLYSAGFLLYKPATLLRFIKTALNFFAIPAAVESEVWSGLYSRAPQKTTLSFFMYFFRSFVVWGIPS